MRVLCLAVQTVERLIENQDARLAEQCLNQHHLLKRAAGERAESLGEQARDGQSISECADAALALRARTPP